MIEEFQQKALEWLVQSIMGALVVKFVDYSFQQFGEKHGVEDDLEKLKDSLANAMLQISTIENLWLKDERLQQRLKELLVSLKDAAYDADDLFDEFRYRTLKQQIEQQGDEAGNRASSSSYSTYPPSKKIKISFSSYTSGLSGIGAAADDVQRMREIKGKLDKNSDALEEIYSSLGKEGDRGKKQLVSLASRQTSSFPTEPQLFGRDKELQELKYLLLELEAASKFGQSGFSVLSIAGIGGIGKTTLAQEAFNDKSVKEYFKHRIWVCVSENFCTDRLTREIIEYETKVKCDLTNFAALQAVLKRKIMSGRFLLVLDDLWDEDMHKWEILCAPLRSGKPGSKILVTTRSRKIANMVGDVDPIYLEGLDEESFWEFFKKCAFGSSNSRVHHPHLEAMAKKMTCKLKGLPLAAKTLGRLLSMKFDEQYWKSILYSEIWELPQEENGIMPGLQLSYQYLPPHLKQCFAFCSLFPKDYEFSDSELISIWIAEGFIVPQGSIRMEELGSNYFHELVNWSFFQKSKSGEFIMHDLIHDLAIFISMGESYRVEKGKSHEIPNTIRHLSMHEEEDMQIRRLTEFSYNNKLRTLMLPLRYTSKSFLFNCDLLEKLKKIHVLVLRNCALEELDDSIGELIHLRYLDLSENYDIQRLPESLCDLYNLQTLILYRCDNLESLPHGMMKLINLRKLDGADKFISKITNVGKLTSLQNLPAFKVLKDIGHKLAELKGLKQLRGELCITNLENVENKDEANSASLKTKEHLDWLELEWTSSEEYDSEVYLHISEQVLEGLQPHHNLVNLTIKGYNGARPPNWLHEQVYSRLEFLHLENCKRWNDLSVEPLLNLNYLIIENCNELRSVKGLRIKSLQVLKITGCPKLLLSQGEAQTEESPLWELVVDDTAFLKQSPIKNSLSSVKNLRILSSCEAVMFQGEDQESLQSLTCLYSLCFSDCNNLQSLPTKLYTLTSLRLLQIHNCPEIQSLPEKGLPHSLTDLDFQGCNLALEKQLVRHLAEIKRSHR